MSITELNGITKQSTQKSARQLELKVKEELADSYVSCPPAALKSLKCAINGENDEGPFGENTIGQKIEGEVILYAGDTDIVTFAHELVSKTIQSVQMITNSGRSYTFEVPSGSSNPALEFAYGDGSQLVDEGTTPTIIVLKITGYRDNLALS